MHLALFIDSLGLGGAQRMVTALANHWAQHGHRVSIPLLSATGSHFFPLDPRVAVCPLDASASRRHPILKPLVATLAVMRLRAWLAQTRPDVLLAFMDQPNLIACLARRGMSIRLVISERSDPERGSLLSKHWPRPLRGLVRHGRDALYRTADLLVVQTQALAREFPVTAREGIAVIPNWVEPPLVTRAHSGCAGDYVLTVGRLSPEKRHRLVVDAFARIAPRYPDLSLLILGDGPERPRLNAQIEHLGLSNRVKLMGAVADPMDAMRHTRLFMHTSEYEGFPNALLEAMAAGAPCVAVDCRYGPSEIIRDGQTGLLLSEDSIECIAAGMEQVLSSNEFRARLSRNASEVLSRFSKERIIEFWDRCLDSTGRQSL